MIGLKRYVRNAAPSCRHPGHFMKHIASVTKMRKPNEIGIFAESVLVCILSLGKPRGRGGPSLRRRLSHRPVKWLTGARRGPVRNRPRALSQWLSARFGRNSW